MSLLNSRGNHTVGLRVIGLAASMSLIALAAPAKAAINLELQPGVQIVNVGDTVNVGLYASSDTSVNQALAALNVILGWDTGYLQLTGHTQAGAVPMMSTGFPLNDPYGINGPSFPADGDALFVGFAPLGNPALATPAGSLITTFQFTALAQTSGTLLDILTSAGSPLTNTVVYDGFVPALDVTGTLTGSTIIIIPTPASVAALALGFFVMGRRRRAG